MSSVARVLLQCWDVTSDYRTRRDSVVLCATTSPLFCLQKLGDGWQMAGNPPPLPLVSASCPVAFLQIQLSPRPCVTICYCFGWLEIPLETDRHPSGVSATCLSSTSRLHCQIAIAIIPLRKARLFHLLWIWYLQGAVAGL